MVGMHAPEWNRRVDTDAAANATLQCSQRPRPRTPRLPHRALRLTPRAPIPAPALAMRDVLDTRPRRCVAARASPAGCSWSTSRPVEKRRHLRLGERLGTTATPPWTAASARRPRPALPAPARGDLHQGVHPMTATACTLAALLMFEAATAPAVTEECRSPTTAARRALYERRAATAAERRPARALPVRRAQVCTCAVRQDGDRVTCARRGGPSTRAWRSTTSRRPCARSPRTAADGARSPASSRTRRLCERRQAARRQEADAPLVARVPPRDAARTQTPRRPLTWAARR
jgi:hypothetical protein